MSALLGAGLLILAAVVWFGALALIDGAWTMIQRTRDMVAKERARRRKT